MITFLTKIKIYFKHFFYYSLYYSYIEWKKEVYDRDLDEYMCCSGDMCCCNGLSIEETYA